MVTTYPLTGKYVSSVYTTDDLAYAACHGGGSCGFQIVDVSVPSSPVPRGSYSFLRESAQTRAISVSGNYAYLLSSDDGIRIVFVYNPDNSFYMDRIIMGGGWLSVAGERLILGSFLAGAVIYDLSVPANPVQVANVDHYLADIAMNGDYAFLLDEENGLWVVDASDPTNPTVALNYEIARALQAEVVGDFAFVLTDYDTLIVLDVADPLAPSSIARFDIGHRSNALDAEGELACVATDDSGAIDIDDVVYLIAYIFSGGPPPPGCWFSDI